MKNIKNNILIIFVVFYFTASPVNADYPISAEISTINKNIRIGEPLILKLTFRFENPQVSEEKAGILHSINHQMSIRIYHKEDLTNEIFLSKRKHSLYLEDNNGLVYGGNIILLYDTYKNKLIFDSPGTYTIIAKRTNTLSSNPLDINIDPASSSEKEMLSMLSEPGDFDFIVYGSETYFEKKPERISIIKSFIDKYENTELAQMAAARLGIEFAKKLEKKYSSAEKIRTEYKEGSIKEPLLEQSQKYLKIGAELPDEFPIRQETLFQLSRIEFMKDNINNVISLIDEIAEKYPHSKYGREAIAAQEKEIPKLKAEMQNKSVQPRQKKPLSIFLPVTTVVITGVFIVGYVLLRQKKMNVQKK